MTVIDMRHWEPTLDIKLARGFRDQVLMDLRDRVISFELEDDFRRPVDKCTLVLNNNDGGLMDVQSLALGVTFTIAFGYVGDHLPPRLMQCRKMKGAFRVGGLGPDSAPNTTAGGVVRLELFSQVWNMNMYRAVGKTRAATDAVVFGEEEIDVQFDPTFDAVVEDRELLFINKTVPQIVRELAEAQGFLGASLLVQDLPDEVPLERYVIPTDFSAAEWIADKARERGWVFAVDNDGFHFHQQNFEPANIEVVNLSWFRGDPDVISWELDGDLNVPQNVQVRGGDREREFIVGVSKGPLKQGGSSSSETGFVRSTVLIKNKDSRGRSLSPDLLIATSDIKRKQVQRVERILSRAENRWKLKMTLVGNPNVKARRSVNLQNFGPLVDGVWYIRKAVHKYAANQVYITEIEARRRSPGTTKYTIGVIHGTLGKRGSLLISEQ